MFRSLLLHVMLALLSVEGSVAVPVPWSKLCASSSLDMMVDVRK